MSDWLDTLRTLRDAGKAAVVVTVASTRGSVPREAGTNMIVTADAVHGTIGGGHLEHKAIAIARDRLAAGDAPGALRRFPLGASLGQCCGGIVELLFETVSDDAAWTDLLADARRRDEHATGFTIVLFGAGHVGRALVRGLAGLPCRVTWVDERADAFPRDVPPNVTPVCTDIPEQEVDAAPPGAYFLVMTHSHALDEALAEAILRRADHAYFGLIGSVTKRRAFERRLARRGMPVARFATMTCPIGVAGIPGKEPAAIAIAVAAQMLQVRARKAGSDTTYSAATRIPGTRRPDRMNRV